MNKHTFTNKPQKKTVLTDIWDCCWVFELETKCKDRGQTPTNTD